MPPGAPNLFRAEVGRNLNKVFPPQFGGFEIPQILSGNVVLTTDFPATAPYLNFSIYDNIGAADVTQILAAVVPPDGYIWIIDEMSVLCTDLTSRRLSLRIRYVTPLGTFSVAAFTVDTGTSGLPIAVGRRLILPPGAILDLSVPVLTAGANLRWTLMYFQVGAGQWVPKS